MSLLCCRPLPSTATLLVAKVAARQLLPFLLPIELSVARTSPPRRRQLPCRRLQQEPTSIGVETWFISALVEAGRCPNHRANTSKSSFLSQKTRPKLPNQRLSTFKAPFRKYQHTKAADPEEADNLAEENLTREELLELVDGYDGESYTDQLPVLDIPQLYQPSNGPYLTVSDKPEDEWPPPHYTWPASPETKIILKKLNFHLKDHTKDPQRIYELYRSLPGFRVTYLESKARHYLLHRLAGVQRKEEHSMLRYMSVVDDVRTSAIPLNIAEWNTALSFIGRYVSYTTEVEVEAVLKMWKEMEQAAGVQADSATFNILFDVACKAGKFTLAEMVYEEMERRNLEYDRTHHVSMIVYYGLKRNGDAARVMYRQLVEAGEMVDTVVLNAMISALLRSREPNAARNIYERMKRSFLEGPNIGRLSARNFRGQRRYRSYLKRRALEARTDEVMRVQCQRNTRITPSIVTFQLLIKHYSIVAGDLEETTQLLDDMKIFGLPLHGVLFQFILIGFARHGGIRYTLWTEDRLESVWKAFFRALDKKDDGLFISKRMAIWGLRAFAQCSGHARALQAWEEVKTKWEPNEEELDYVMYNLRKLLETKDMSLERYDWILGTL